MARQAAASLRSSWGALARAQSAIAERSARPRKLVLGSYAFFALAFVSLLPGVLGTALLAAALNGVITLACALILATVERWAPRIRDGQAPLFERTLQLATLLWLYAGGVFLLVGVTTRI